MAVLSDTRDALEGALGTAGPERERSRERLLGRLRPMLVLWAGTRMSPRLKARMEPEDVAQEILTRVLRGLDRFQAGHDGTEMRAFHAWLFTLGENCIRDLVSREEAVKRRPPEPLGVSQTSPSQAANRREQVDRMLGALDALEPEDRDVIRLLKLQGLSAAEAAPLLHKSPNAVRIQLCRALKALHARLAGPESSTPSSETPPRSPRSR